MTRFPPSSASKLDKLPPSAVSEELVGRSDSPTGARSSSAQSKSSMLQARLKEQHALLLQAQEQARQAKAAAADARRTQRQLWLAVQVVAPVALALIAGLALGEAISRPARGGRT